ncbi:hypothetical protein GE107_05140 [Cohnella sp. CFH 77786]|uniref:BtrH N-terminal domain-containing protein n=1 Tax=Cohnella sp. CFH 77786 TaxID=2662265 RepID=UPI001C608DF2|nr:BtrH N-terminal domain-containing protein [Cohnella sp. CFH 77786]MBW5445445.1 hypothetical protein [Cohnella sp. CFH 77786]
MEDVVLLPLSRPIIASWANHAHIFSIIERNPESSNWIYSNYIQLELVESLHGGPPLLNYSFPKTPEESCRLLEVSRSTRESVAAAGGAVAFLKESARNGCYAYLFLNAYHLPHYPFYHIKHLPHDPLVRGYDERKRLFFLSDFHLADGGILQYGTFAVPFKQLELAYEDMAPAEDKLDGIELFGYRAEAVCPFERDQVKLYLSDYLNASFTQDKEETWLATQVSAYGVAVYDYVLEHLSRVLEKREEPDFRLIHVLHDHKFLMLRRLEHMKNLGYVREEAAQAYEPILKQCAMIRNLALKFGVSGNLKFLSEANVVLRAIPGEEKRILESLLARL